ncbi:MAG: hypothetical protein IPL52_14350 [Flavobacteriales bacterium]|nr:hypothetical protein [Flavobacteriales bacterium]
MHRGAYLVGVAGGSGSGKTSLVRALRESLPDGMVCQVSQDDYYHPKERQETDPSGRINFDLPTAVDLDALARDLALLVAGEPIRKREYTFNQEGRDRVLIELRPAPVILVEGLFVLHHQPVRDLFDLKVFIEASEDAQLDRRLRRDAEERGYGREDVLYQWEHHVLPAYRDFLLPYRHLCDLHVVNEIGFERARCATTWCTLPGGEADPSSGIVSNGPACGSWTKRIVGITLSSCLADCKLLSPPHVAEHGRIQAIGHIVPTKQIRTHLGAGVGQQGGIGNDADAGVPTEDTCR